MEKLKEDGEGFVKYLLEEKQLAPTTIELYYGYYTRLPEEINQQSIKEFVIKGKNYPGVRAFAKAYLYFKGLDKDITLPQRASGRIKQRVIRNVTPKEINAIRDFLYQKNYQSGLIFDIMYQGSLRISEVLTLKVNSFDWKQWLNDPKKMGRLFIVGKGRKERYVLIFPETMQDILEQLQNKSPDSDIDFISNSKMLLFDNIYKMKVYRLIKRASMQIIKKDLRSHELRHASATELLRRGVDILYIRDYLGHSSVATTEIYLHTSAEESLSKIESNLLGI